MTTHDPILIAGGGLGGLTTALALARHGHATRVLEGAAEFGAIGYGIQFGPNVFHVFDRLGLMDEVLAVADAPAALLLLDALDGKELLRIPTGASFRARFKYPYVIVHRIDLHERAQDPRDYDFIASLGSEFAAFDDSKPFIPREAELLRAIADTRR